MPESSVKEKARRLIENLAEDATWEDILREVALRRAIDEGLEDVEENRTLSTSELEARIGTDD